MTARHPHGQQADRHRQQHQTPGRRTRNDRRLRYRVGKQRTSKRGHQHRSGGVNRAQQTAFRHKEQVPIGGHIASDQLTREGQFDDVGRAGYAINADRIRTAHGHAKRKTAACAFRQCQGVDGGRLIIAAGG
ncbi:MAG: hypothetical protein BWZ07_02302 [Alphaproteobacteria bacterium ADurb.BinA280]|nr:MAG: hypothetical protein BWZ07_02302 [Alphaproteobacteria bacterium ADurb.BinA280]